MIKSVKSTIFSFGLKLVYNYPSSKNLSYGWNFGSMLGFLMVVQVFSGILLLLYYVPSEQEAFLSVDYMSRESFFGFSVRLIHLNGASFLFVFLYLHVFRGLYYSSFRDFRVWGSGSLMLLLMMVTAFLGYVLPMGQMSFWGATVITNLVSTIPYIGPSLVLWMWGGFSINKASLSFFFLMHFLMPFVILMVVFFHLLFLHLNSSTSLILVHESFSKVKFFPYFVFKDLLNVFFYMLLFSIMFFFPWIMGDPENWSKANPMMSPVHIQPEWYFLFAYAILRAIPNKLGGVIALVMSVLILPVLSLNKNYKTKIFLKNKFFCFNLIFIFLLLTWLGACPVEAPFLMYSQILSFMYFFNFFILMI